jgi:hypothetical protein
VDLASPSRGPLPLPGSPLICPQTITACLHTLLEDSDLGVVVEAVDSMFELYSDESRDVVFLELAMLPRCQQTLKDMRAKVRQPHSRQ